MKIATLLLSCLTAGVAQAQTIATLWKGRAVEAEEYILRAADAGGASTDRCAVLLEFAFAHAAKVFRRTGGVDAFHMIIKDSAEEMLDFVYVYELDGDPSGIRIDRLPRGWQIVALLDDPDGVAVSTGGGKCLWRFDLKNPVAIPATDRYKFMRKSAVRGTATEQPHRRTPPRALPARGATKGYFVEEARTAHAAARRRIGDLPTPHRRDRAVADMDGATGSGVWRRSDANSADKRTAGTENDPTRRPRGGW